MNETQKLNISSEEVEQWRKTEREYITTKFRELIGKQISIKDRWTDQKFNACIDNVVEIDLPFPRQCLVDVRWLSGETQRYLGSSHYKKLEQDKHEEILDLKTKDIVLTSEANTERMLNNHSRDLLTMAYHDSVVKGAKLPVMHRSFDIVGNEQYT